MLTNSWPVSPGAIPCWFPHIHINFIHKHNLVHCLCTVLFFFFNIQNNNTYRHIHLHTLPLLPGTSSRVQNQGQQNNHQWIIWLCTFIVETTQLNKTKKNNSIRCFNTWMKQEKLCNGTFASPLAVFVSMHMIVIILIWTSCSNLQFYNFTNIDPITKGNTMWKKYGRTQTD